MYVLGVITANRLSTSMDGMPLHCTGTGNSREGYTVNRYASYGS